MQEATKKSKLQLLFFFVDANKELFVDANKGLAISSCCVLEFNDTVSHYRIQLVVGRDSTTWE